MDQLAKRNLAVLCVAAAIVTVGFIFPRSGKILELGSVFGLSAFLVAKGASPLPCHNSDVLLSLFILALIVTSKMPAATPLSLVLEISAILLTLIFTVTGLTFKAIAREQKRRREIARYGRAK
jgi:hypothetical protein